MTYANTLCDEKWARKATRTSTSIVEVSIGFRNLENRDTFSKSDPMCVIYHRPPGSKTWTHLLRTETIENDLDPDFVTKLTIEYKFEQQQDLKFHVYDVDSESLDLTEHESLGFADTTLAKIVQAGDAGFITELSGLTYKDYDRPISTIVLIAEELASEKEEVALKLCGNAIGKWSGPLPPKTFFQVSKMTQSEKFKYLVVHRSPPCRGSNPVWAPLKISSRHLCNGDFERVLKIEVIQILFSGAYQQIGSTLLSLSKMIQMSPKESVNLTTSKGEETKASVRILSCTTSPVHTFMEYIRVTQLNCWFSIDFSCSNGDPHDPVSLHYLGKAGSETVEPNMYEQAIRAVGNVLQDYDDTGLYPAYGFGARLPPIGDLSYDFPLTLTDSPNCGSIDGVLEQYRLCLPQLQLYGPTYFAPVIKIIAETASKSRPGENYYILVILTDGVITDLEETKKEIVEASELPLSIVIVGIGEAEFDTMEELDGDGIRLTYKKKVASRDLVQFVPYRNARLWMWSTGESTAMTDKDGQQSTSLEDDNKPEKPKLSQEELEKKRMSKLIESKLAQEILAEIPDQLTSYMRLKGITPNMIKKPLANTLATQAKLNKLTTFMKPPKAKASPTPPPPAKPTETPVKPSTMEVITEKPNSKGQGTVTLNA